MSHRERSRVVRSIVIESIPGRLWREDSPRRHRTSFRRKHSHRCRGHYADT